MSQANMDLGNSNSGQSCVQIGHAGGKSQRGKEGPWVWRWHLCVGLCVCVGLRTLAHVLSAAEGICGGLGSGYYRRFRCLPVHVFPGHMWLLGGCASCVCVQISLRVCGSVKGRTYF